MSYDLRVAVKVEGCEKYAEIAEPRTCSSPTYNLGKMFRSCTEWDFVQGEYYKCSDVIGKIEHGIEELENAPEFCKKYEPSNKRPGSSIHRENAAGSHCSYHAPGEEGSCGKPGY